jgi:hypothetical protein
MTTLSDWDREMDRMSAAEMEEMADHLGALNAWPFFRKAYKGHGLTFVRRMLRARAELLRLQETQADLDRYDDEAYRDADGN